MTTPFSSTNFLNELASCHCDNKQLKRGKVYFSSVLNVIIHHGKEVMVEGAVHIMVDRSRERGRYWKPG
jgi:hypothetical protein